MADDTIKQRVRTGLRCPLPGCGGELLLMHRKADGRRFLACARWFVGGAGNGCQYTSNTVPEHVKAREAGVPMLPLFDA
jgi:hypothetical protein